ncbi:unnamed protein product [Blepharisma stoltei]|uniref:Ion transport domain-containing protein n=1 Tax=Blepharisma stoltei TaxID=1481888 RepID=A0AAU9JM81_9CILI|nr:unnamed protein product [Blepharisma stoltei]
MKKKHFKIFTYLRVFEVMVVYVMVNHFCGSYFIECAKREDANHSWLSRVPSPQPEQYRTNSSEPLTRDTVYTHAFHWSSIVVSHAGYGWVVSNSPAEKAYNCFVFLIGLFAYSILFGSITSLVAELCSSDPKFTFENSYWYVKDFIDKKQLGSIFMEKINDYFDYLLRSSKGIYDENILKELPPSLMSDIQFYRYSEVLRMLISLKIKMGALMSLWQNQSSGFWKSKFIWWGTLLLTQEKKGMIYWSFLMEKCVLSILKVKRQ